jgi:3-oxoacyl-[acyl-carrier-protein] synthase III
MNNKKTNKTVKDKYSPTLNTIKMVEKALKEMPDSMIKVSELKRLLPKQINHNTLKNILEYLQESNKIFIGIKGIVWIHNDSPKLRKAILDAERDGRVL